MKSTILTEVLDKDTEVQQLILEIIVNRYA